MPNLTDDDTPVDICSLRFGIWLHGHPFVLILPADRTRHWQAVQYRESGGASPIDHLVPHRNLMEDDYLIDLFEACVKRVRNKLRHSFGTLANQAHLIVRSVS